MRIAIASDRGGYKLKQFLFQQLRYGGYTVDDFGCDDPQSSDYSKGYPDYAEIVARLVSSGEYERGILICGTGIGMSIAANKVAGVRCALVHDIFSAKQSRIHNDANVMALGEMLMEPELGHEIAKVWLRTEFAGNHSRIEKIKEIECNVHTKFSGEE